MTIVSRSSIMATGQKQVAFHDPMRSQEYRTQRSELPEDLM